MPDTSADEMNVILHGLKHTKSLEVEPALYTSMQDSIEFQYLLVSIVSMYAERDICLREALLTMFAFGVDAGYLIQHPEQIPACPGEQSNDNR